MGGKMTNKGLKERVNHIEKELQQIKQQLKPNKKITLKEFWESEEELAIHCDTEEKAKALLSAFDKMGKKWLSGDLYSTCSYWNNYNRETVYYNNRIYGDLLFARNRNIKVYEFEDVDLAIPKEYQFTEDEKTILRNLGKKYKWLVRDRHKYLYVFEGKPYKSKKFDAWTWISDLKWADLSVFSHLFQSIQWEDEEPIEIAKVIGD